MDFEIKPGLPNHDEPLVPVTIAMDGTDVFVVYAPTEEIAMGIARGLRNSIETNNAFKHALIFIAGIRKRDGQPVASAAIAQRALDAAQRRARA